MRKLNEMPNIGKTLEQKLIAVGIDSVDELVSVGSKEAFLRLKASDSGACLSMLSALEGAIQGVRWHYLDEKIKAELKHFYESLN